MALSWRGWVTKWCLDEWLIITHDPWVLEAIKGVKIEWDNLPEQNGEPEPYRMSDKKRKIIGEEILLLLEKGVLEKCQDSEGQFISNVYLKPKPNRKLRMILDLSILKGDLTYQHFKMERLQTALDLLNPGWT